LKHRILRSTDRGELVAAMTRSLRFMAETGTTACIEFREGGVEGVRAIEDAAEETPVDPVVLGRETVAALRESDGFGASGANDADFTEERAAAMEAQKTFAIHAGEVDASDLTPAMDLHPDFLVHVVHPESDHLERLAEERTPVVVCPRSNLATKVGVPPIDVLAERTTLALGTDNVMTNSPSMFREMEFAAKLSDGRVTAPDVLRMATVAGADLAGLDCGCIEPDRIARLLVLDGDSDSLAGYRDPVRAVVRRAGVDDVKRVLPA
jgi:cytosine/adenosine deaminase-related metal-dependent hydrolase